MDSATIQWLSLVALICFTPFSSASHPSTIPKLRPRLNPKPSPEATSPDFKTFFYDQTLDHFNFNPESYATFRQQYVINSKYWAGANNKAPIFAYLGSEAPLTEKDYHGFTLDNAPRFKSLLVYIEHRFYGQSVPFVKFEEALMNKTLRGYFNSAQAIADYAEILLHIKKTFAAPHSPIIVVGGSYGGMLASWMRLKYPHIAFGALASSAPILYFDDITPQNGYLSIVSKGFEEASRSCYETIKKSWSIIDEVASKPNGLSILAKTFNTCRPLNKTSELKEYLGSIYSEAAQYNAPPSYPVTKMCAAIDGAPKETDILGRVFAGIVEREGKKSCYDTNKPNLPTETNRGYGWQECTEMVMPIGCGNETMFEANPYSLRRIRHECNKKYGDVTPRRHWITTYYGGQDIKRVLRNFASNIIFSNGLRDPYSSAGVLKDISKTVVALATVNGSHCLDVLPETKSDPEWLVNQRKKIVENIEGWIKKYNDDFHLSDQ